MIPSFSIPKIKETQKDKRLIQLLLKLRLPDAPTAIGPQTRKPCSFVYVPLMLFYNNRPKGLNVKWGDLRDSYGKILGRTDKWNSIAVYDNTYKYRWMPYADGFIIEMEMPLKGNTSKWGFMGFPKDYPSPALWLAQSLPLNIRLKDRRGAIDSNSIRIDTHGITCLDPSDIPNSYFSPRA